MRTERLEKKREQMGRINNTRVIRARAISRNGTSNELAKRELLSK